MKKVISLFLSLVLILSTLSIVDLSAYANENTDEIVGKADYSNLTQNQYISRILLNYNYLGAANDYNSANEPAEKSELEFWLNPVNVSFARILVNELQSNSEFMDSVKGWEVLTFSPGELASDAFKEDDYYTTILLSILDAKVSDNEFIKDINCTTNKTILSITKNTTKFLKEFCSIDISNMENVSVDNLTNTQYNDMLDDMLDTLENSENSKELYDLIGKDIGYISDATKACKSVSDVIKTVSMYSKLAETSKATQQVLYDVYINCPADNAAMKSAAKKVYEYTSNSLSKEILTLMESGEAVFSFGFDKIINKIWGKVLTAVLGEFGAGLLIGQAVGKSISNFLFSTDAVIDKYYAMNALVKFEDVITKVVTETGNSYKQNENSNNADNYLRSIELMFATYNLGYDYTKDFSKIVFEKGLINSIKNLFGYNETADSIQSNVESVKSSVELAYGLVSINSYKFYLEIDDPSLYQAIYGDISSNIPVSEMNIEQIKELNVGDNGPAYDFFSITYGPENYTETILGENVSSSNESVIAVDNSNCIGGYISVVGSGTCTLTFTTYNDKHSNSIEVTVGELYDTNVFEFGDGSEENPYQVSTPRQLNAVRNDLSAYYIQICDIDMLNWKKWVPIGTKDYPFEGYYDGNNCSIKNLNIEIDKEQDSIEYVGLFGNSTRTLKNISLIDFSCSVLNNCICIGSICGKANKIINCTSSGEIDAYCINGGGIAGNAATVTNCVNYNNCSFYYEYKNDFCYYGGICGKASVINKSANQGTLYTSVSNSSYTGGIVGYTTEVSLCYNESYLEARSTSSTAETHLGGIAGCSSNTNNCYNLGGLYANSKYAIIVGGIVSRSFGCTITNCYSLQNISGSTPTYPGRHYGGIIGYSSIINTYVNNCFYNYSALCDTTKFQNSGSKQLSNEQFLLKSSFDGFDFDNVWKISENFNNGKPFLLKSPLHNWNDGVVISSASCSETGLKLYTCSHCGESFEKIISTIDHSFELTKETSSTCTSSGLQEYVCINCGEKKTILTNQIDHVFKDYQSDNNATCTKNGTKTAYCEYGCGQASSIEDENSAPRHSFTNYVNNNDATCTENATETAECDRCDAIDTKVVENSAKGHTYKTYTTKATTSKNGSLVTKCACGDIKSTTTIYYPKTINLSTTKYTYDGKVKKPSIKVVDSKGKTISTSNYTVTYPSGRKNVGKYTVKITFKGNYSGTVSKTFTIIPKTTSISSLTAASKGFTVKWKKQATQATGYQIQIATDSKFTNSVKSYTVSKNSTVSKKITKLTGGKKYYVRIRTYKTVSGTKYYSSWSAKKYVTTKK